MHSRFHTVAVLQSHCVQSHSHSVTVSLCTQSQSPCHCAHSHTRQVDPGVLLSTVCACVVAYTTAVTHSHTHMRGGGSVGLWSCVHSRKQLHALRDTMYDTVCDSVSVSLRTHTTVTHSLTRDEWSLCTVLYILCACHMALTRSASSPLAGFRPKT